MKKISPLFTLVAVAIATLTGCKDDFPKVPTTEPYLNLTTSATTIAVGDSGTLQVVLDRMTDNAVDFTLTSSSPALVIASPSLAIDPQSKDKTAKTDFTTNAVGEVTVEISSDYPGVRFTTKSIMINIVKPQLTLSGARSCAIGAESNFTISSNMNVIEDVVINLTSSDPTKLTVPATVTLKKGSKSIMSTATGVAAGEATITFTTTNDKVEIAKNEDTEEMLNTLKVTVEEAAPVPPTANISFTGEAAATVGNSYAFSISSDINVTEDVTFTLTSSTTATATVPASIVMKSGTNLATGVYTAVAAGTTTITVASTNTNVKIDETKKSFEVTVTAAPAE